VPVLEGLSDRGSEEDEDKDENDRFSQ